MALDECGNIYVADHGNHRIQVSNFYSNAISQGLSLRVSLSGSLSQGLSLRVSLSGSLSQGLSLRVSLSGSLSQGLSLSLWVPYPIRTLVIMVSTPLSLVAFNNSMLLTNVTYYVI